MIVKKLSTFVIDKRSEHLIEERKFFDFLNK